MSGLKCIALPAALVAALLAAGCAATPEPAVSGQGGQGTSASGAISPVIPNLVVDSTSEPPESSRIECREILKQGSNVIIKQCMTVAGWEKFKRREAREAQQIVRMLQGGAYR